MKRKKFAIYAAFACALMGAAAGYGVSRGNVLLPTIVFSIGIVLITLGKRRVKEVMADERTIRISEKASRRIYQIFVMSAALIGMTLVALNKYTEVGYTLAFSACALLLLYIVLYSYYNRRALD